MTQFAPFTPIDEPREDVPLPIVDEPGSRFGKAHHILLIFAGLGLLAWILSGFYKVNPNEVAIVERLGKYISSSADGKADLVEPGLHYHLPWPIDTPYVISTKEIRNLVVDFFDSSPQVYEDVKRQYILSHPGTNASFVNAIFDPYLITGDKNIIHMKVAVQYTIDDPEAWLTTASHEDTSIEQEGMREAIFQQAIQHAMVHMVSTLTIDQMLFAGREQLPVLLRQAVEDAIKLPDPSDPTHTKRIDLGMHVEHVDLVETRPPAFVAADFNLVATARSEQVSLETQAQADANTARTNAEGQALTMKSQGDAYAKKTVETARGEAARFAQVLDQFNKAPDVTRYNIYADAVRTVAGNSTRMMFLQPGQSATLTVDPPQFDANQLPGNAGQQPSNP